jgi:hypothetical protein
MRRAVRPAALLLGLWLAVPAPAALAADWSAKTQLRQSVEASDNRALSNDPAGATYESVSQLMLSTIARLPGLRFDMDVDASYRALAGPGADDNAAPMDNGVRLKAEKLDSSTKYYLLGSWRRQDATSAQITDSGVVLAKGDISTYVLDAGFVRQMSRLDSLSWSIRGTSVDLTSPTPTASSYVDLATTGAWTRRMNPTTDLVSSLQLEWLARDDLANTQTIFARAMVGLNSQVSKALALKGAVGVGVHRTDQDAVLSSPGKQPSEDSVGWLADAQLVYRPAQGTQVWLAAAQLMAPSVVGEIQSRTTLGAGLRYAINHASYLLLTGDFNHQTSLDSLAYDSADYLRASVAYGYRLTPEWQAQLAYRFAERIDETGVAQSNSIFVSVVHDWVMLP